MNDDFGRELRDRLRSAPLPVAPAGLRRRLESVVAGASQPRRGWRLHDRPFLVPVVVGLLVVALAAASLSAGWLSGPDSATPRPSEIALASVPPAATSAPTPRIDCGPPIEPDPWATCEEAIAMARAALEADLPPILGISVSRRCVVALLRGVPIPKCTTTAILRVTFTFVDLAPRTITILGPAPGETPHVVNPRPAVVCAEDQYPAGIACDDAIDRASAALDPGHPPILRIQVHRFCLASIPCQPNGHVVVEITFDTATPQVVRVWIPGEPEAWPIERGVRGEVICPVDDPSGGLVLDCRTAVDLVLGALERDHPPIDSVTLMRGCPPELGLIADCWTYAFGYVEVRYATSPSITVQYFVRGDRDPPVVEVRRP